LFVSEKVKNFLAGMCTFDSETGTGEVNCSRVIGAIAT
jgi:hypothetical protein